jgi:ABC-type phosphate/phosphonate transport system substrate-binding protein
VIASLPMYDRPETAGANDRLWALIRDRLREGGIAAPERLSRGAVDPFDEWEAADLVLSQSCGFPYRTRLHGRVALVGTPDYGVEGCPPGYYCSRIVVRADDSRRTLSEFEGARLAFNDPGSQSGWAALAAHAPRLARGPLLLTGAHAASARAVAEGRADLAALDAVSWALIARAEAFAAGLRIVASTPPTPGLPLIAALGADAAALFGAVAAAIAALSPGDREMLLIRGLVRIPAKGYLTVPTPPPPGEFARAC